MAKDEKPSTAARNQGDFAVQMREDIQSLLADLNIDAVLEP